MFSFKAKARSGTLCALVPTEEGVAFAMVRARKNAKPLLEQYGFQPMVPGQDPQ